MQHRFRECVCVCVWVGGWFNQGLGLGVQGERLELLALFVVLPVPGLGGWGAGDSRYWVAWNAGFGVDGI